MRKCERSDYLFMKKTIFYYIKIFTENFIATFHYKKIFAPFNEEKCVIFKFLTVITY